MSDRQTATNGVTDTDGPDEREDTQHGDPEPTTGDGLVGDAAIADADGSAADARETGDDPALRTTVRRLEEENRRLRDKYAGVREKRYVRTALGLAGVGIAFGLAGLVVTAAQEVLFAIAAAGLFGAVLTRFLTPEQFIPLDIGEGTYAALADNEAAIASQLGLSATHVYLTTDNGPRLFVPELDAYDRSLLHAADEADENPFGEPLVVGDTASRSGLALRPTAEPLLRAFEEQHRGDLPATPREAVATLREGVTDALELAGRVDVDLDSDDGRVTFSVGDPLYGEVTRFDHPISSVLGTGLATALGVPVETEVTTAERDGSVTPLVTCRWDPNAVAVATGVEDENEKTNEAEETEEATPDERDGTTTGDVDVD